MRLPLSCAVAAVLALITAPMAHGAITIGQVPPKPSSVSADACDPGTYATTSTGVPPRYEIPGDGVITSWRTFSTVFANVGPERLKVINPFSATRFKVVAVSEYVNAFSTVDNSNPPYPTRIPVSAGDLIGLGVGPVTPTQSKPHCTFGEDGLTAEWRSKVGVDDPPGAGVLTWGAPPAPTFYPVRVSVSAVVEPDLDHDGFGDESQDRCVTVAGTDNGCPPDVPPGPPAPTPPATTTTPPAVPPLVTLSAVTVSPKSFRAARSGSSVLSAKSKAGTKVSFVLDQGATVLFTVARSQAGRQAGGGRCVAITSRNRKSRKCKRLVTAPGSFTRSGLAATNSFRFTGRLGARTLKPGQYQLIATPAANGQTGAPVRTAFSIVK